LPETFEEDAGCSVAFPAVLFYFHFHNSRKPQAVKEEQYRCCPPNTQVISEGDVDVLIAQIQSAQTFRVV
jgi:hypothetical protein